MFEGTLGNYTGSKYKIELLEGLEPYHTKPFPIPKIYKQIPKTEVNRLIFIWRCKNSPEWVAPTFVFPRKNGIIRIIFNFRELNKKIKKKHFPIPKIQDLLLKLEGF